jgi:hypothetical protein
MVAVVTVLSRALAASRKVSLMAALSLGGSLIQALFPKADIRRGRAGVELQRGHLAGADKGDRLAELPKWIGAATAKIESAAQRI